MDVAINALTLWETFIAFAILVMNWTNFIGIYIDHMLY